MISGCDALTSYVVVHGYSHRRAPPPGVSPTTRDAVNVTICRTPPSVTSIGDEYEAVSSRADHARLPVAALYATTDLPFDPPGRTTTVSSTASGAAAMPHCKLDAPLSSRMLTRQIRRPVASSSARSSPVAPCTKTRPFDQVGVARGPSPPIISLNTAFQLCVHNSRPVAMS